MAEYKKQFADAPPVVGVVTDFVVHAFWIHNNIEAYAVATPEMRATLIARGIPRDRIVVSGIPVRSDFSQRSPDACALRERLGLPHDRQTVLLMGGGLGIGPLESMMHALDRVQAPLCAVAIVGRSARSEQRVLEYAHRVSYPVRVVRFVNNVHEYMHAADVLITKPGGLTSAEALVAQVPTVLFKPLPGQEERNTRYLVQRRAALRAKNPADLTRTVEALLLSEEKRSTMRAAMAQLGKPDAAAQISAMIRALAGRAEGEQIA
jgi:processive 1,2-diacylglycerol beta-glucosyltransferase